MLSKLILDLEQSGKDSIRVNPLIEFAEFERANYKPTITNSANLIYWSYGSTSMTGERVVARDCYYLKVLGERGDFYLAIIEKVNGTLINL